MELVHATAIFAGLALDRILGDPQRHHPVAYFGSFVGAVEKCTYRDCKWAGVGLVAATVVPMVVVTRAAYRRAPALTTALALWAALGGRTLEETGVRLATDLECGDLDAARAWIPWLCSRDPQLLDAAGMARAAVESIAENTSDAAIAPIVWAAIAGAPGVVLHRCVNTLDAMVGYRNDRYSNYGWAAAQLDDVLAFVPARLTAATHVLLAATRRRGAAAITAWREDAPQHPSPNAGPVEATAAAALGVQLGGETHYSYGVEQRPTLGSGPQPGTGTIRDAVRLARATQVLVAIGVIGLRSVLPRHAAS
ncbi:adenosylcobinamide-phosphate synthase CbiB [Corynebacterium sp. H128]|uniref:adenosylcobinamide-phosphate synthase CbiB n=1 Tax=Corynebacterium sp. H128 TaxID=3133427 RepID=UPI00309A1A87